MEEVFQGSRKDGGQSRLVGGQRVKEQRQEPRKSEVHIEETRGKQRPEEPEQNRN